jgi:hypothetical protein
MSHSNPQGATGIVSFFCLPCCAARDQPVFGASSRRTPLVPLNLDGFLFSADYQSGKKAEITSRVAANFVGWEKDHALLDRELEKVIRALRTGEGGREKPPPARL